MCICINRYIYIYIYIFFVFELLHNRFVCVCVAGMAESLQKEPLCCCATLAAKMHGHALRQDVV